MESAHRQTCCFTGHREIPINAYTQLEASLEAALQGLLHHGYTCFAAGGALGFDTLAALAVLRLRQQQPHVKLMLVLPCKDQTRNWNKKDVIIYKHIINQADSVIYTSEHYYSGCMYKRNRRLVDISSVCICYMNHAAGGTAYTVHYAKGQGVNVINLAEDTGALGG